jgi:hypothetical protein
MNSFITSYYKNEICLNEIDMVLLGVYIIINDNDVEKAICQRSRTNNI